jgi:hypothetical protein
MIRSLALALAAVTVALAAPAAAQTTQPPLPIAPAAQPGPQPGLAIADVSAWLTSKGGVVGPVQRQGDEIFITVQDGPMTWFIFFYGCRNDVCADIQYSAVFSNPSITPDLVNAWNRDQRFLKAFYVPAVEGGQATAAVQYDLLLQPGGIDQLNDPTAVWVALLGRFGAHIGFIRQAPAQPPAVQ